MQLETTSSGTARHLLKHGILLQQHRADLKASNAADAAWDGQYSKVLSHLGLTVPACFELHSQALWLLRAVSAIGQAVFEQVLPKQNLSVELMFI